MLQLMGKKIITILCKKKNCLSGRMCYETSVKLEIQTYYSLAAQSTG